MIFYAALYAIVSVAWLLILSRARTHLRISTLAIVFGLGLLSGPIAGLLSGAIVSTGVAAAREPILSDFLLFFFVVGPVEELCKFGAVITGALRRSDFASSADGLVLAITAALGFACGENVLYLTAYGVEATLPRLILGNLGHAAFSCFWGYALGVVLNEGAPFSLLVGALGLCSLAHGLYNFLLGFEALGALGALTFCSILVWILFRLLRQEKDRHRS